MHSWAIASKTVIWCNFFEVNLEGKYECAHTNDKHVNNVDNLCISHPYNLMHVWRVPNVKSSLMLFTPCVNYNITLHQHKTMSGMFHAKEIICVHSLQSATDALYINSCEHKLHWQFQFGCCCCFFFFFFLCWIVDVRPKKANSDGVRARALALDELMKMWTIFAESMHFAKYLFTSDTSSGHNDKQHFTNKRWKCTEQLNTADDNDDDDTEIEIGLKKMN